MKGSRTRSAARFLGEFTRFPLLVLVLVTALAATADAQPCSTTVSTTLTIAAPAELACGSRLRVTLTIDPPFEGEATLYDGATDLGTVLMGESGSAIIAFAQGLAIGTHTFTATFAPYDPCVEPATANAVSHQVNPVPTTLVLNVPAKAECGDPVTFAATLSPAHIGTVKFFDGTSLIGTAAVNAGVATLNLPSGLAAGSHSIAASYVPGIGCGAPSDADPVTHTVHGVPITLELYVPAQIACGAQFQMTGTVSPVFPGQVTFHDGATPVASANVDAGGHAMVTLTTSVLAAGDGAGMHTITASYAPSHPCATPSTSPARELEVPPVTTSLWVASNANPAQAGDHVTFTATVAPSTTPGIVEFFDGAISLGTAPLNNGSAVLLREMQSAGTLSIQAVFAGQGCWLASTSAVFEQVVVDGPPQGPLNLWVRRPDAPASFQNRTAFYEGPSQTVRIFHAAQTAYAYRPYFWSTYATNALPGGVQVADPLGRRYLAISSTGVWAIPRSGNLWSPLAVSGTPPSSVSAAVFDPVRNRAIVFASGNALWQLTLDGAPAWSQIGTYPTSSAFLYDPVGDRIVGVTFTTLWSLPLGEEPPTWSSQAIGGTQPRAWGQFVHDLRGHRLLSWGGGYFDCTFPPCHTVYVSETRALNLAGAPSWSVVSSSGGIGNRLAPTAAYDYVRNQLFVTGGYYDYSLAPDQPFFDTWTLQLAGDPSQTDIDPPSVDFGQVPGLGTYQRTFQVSATGAANSVIFAIVSSSPQVTVDARAFALAPGQSRVVTVTWNGWNAQLDATLEIECSDPTTLRTIPVTGTSLNSTGVGPAGERAFGIALSGRHPSSGPAHLELTMAVPGAVEVTIHDLRGSLVRRLAEGVREPGRHPLEWDGRDGAGRRAPAGIYFVRARTGAATSGLKLVLSR